MDDQIEMTLIKAHFDSAEDEVEMKMRFVFSLLICLHGLAIPAFADNTLSAVNLDELRELTPDKLIRSFADFTFELNPQLQEAETFLQRRRGDCDDFASLASQLLNDRGYKTKLVVVMMPHETHVVCYVEQAGGFLDFNHRNDSQPIIASDGSLEAIAEKVAADFRTRWQMASEIRYQNRRPVYLENVFPMARSSPGIIASRAISKHTGAVTNLLETTARPAISKQSLSLAALLPPAR